MPHPLLEQVLPANPELRDKWLRKLQEAVPVVSAEQRLDQGWQSLDALAQDSQTLRQWLDRETQAQGAPDVRVSASQVFKRLCLDVLYTLILQSLLEQKLPPLTPALLFARWSEQKGMVDLAYAQDLADGAAAGGLGEQSQSFIASFNQLMNDLHGLFHTELRVSNGSYWSSGALALVRPWSQLLKRVSDSDSEPLAQAATAYLDQFEPRLRRFMDWELTGQGDGSQVWRPRRHGCCLKYRLPEGSLCGTCGRHRHLEKRHRREDEAAG